MLRFIALAFVAILVACALRAEEPPQASYESLLAEAKKGNAKVDFARLRLAFTQTPSYNPISIDDAANRMNATFAMLDYEGAIAAAEKVLAKKFVDLSAHKIAAESYDELEKPEKAQFHRAIYKGLVDSILKSGDGKSPATAYVVIATDEEYAVLESLGIRPMKQSLLKAQGASFDRLDGFHAATRQPATLYFNVTIPFQAIEKQFERK